jgi:hypothetical protein
VPVTLPGPAGDLEAVWSEGRPGLAAAVVCHPHPAHGGTMNNRVVHTVHRVLSAAGHPTLRFNFRGAGRSQGRYSGGNDEIGDLAAAGRFARERAGGAGLWLAGFSFGAWIALQWAAKDRAVERIAVLGLATGTLSFDFLKAPPAPLLIVQGDHDHYGSLGSVQALAARLGLHGPVNLRVVSRADHFFTGRLTELAHVLRSGLGIPEPSGEG